MLQGHPRGLIVMFIGCLLLALLNTMATGFPLVVTALGVTAFGTRLFKGNLNRVGGGLPFYRP